MGVLQQEEQCQHFLQACWLGAGVHGEAGAPPDLFLFCVAAVVLRRRRRVMAECQSQDDTMRMFNTARVRPLLQRMARQAA